MGVLDLEGLKKGKSTLVGPVVGALAGALVGALVGFAVRGGPRRPRPTAKFPVDTSPPLLLEGGGGFTENPRGRVFQERGGGVYVEFGGGGGGGRGPIYRENEPRFRRKRL